MSRRPNAGGGRKNQNQANVPARARFSNWKPPSKALAHKFERQLREEEVVPPPPKPTATFGFSVPLSSNSRSGSSDSSRKDSREASALPVKSSFTLPPKCDPTQISNLTVSPSLLRQLVRMLGLEVIMEPARVMQPVPITPCEDFALKPVGKDTDQSVTEMASQSLPSTKRDKSSTAQSPYNLSDSTVPSTIHPKLEKLLNLFSSVGFTRDEVNSTLLHRTVPSTISKVSCDDKLNSNWEGADSVLVALLLAFHGVDWPAAAPEDSSLIEECEDMLNEELLSLQSIYGEKEFSFKKVSVDGQKCCRVTVQLAGNLVVVIYLLNTVHYPVQNWDVLAWVYCLDSVVVDNVASRSGTSSNRRFRNVSKSATSIVRSRLSAGSPILFETVQEFIDQSRSVTLNVESEEALESVSVSASKSKRIANANVSAKSVLSTQATSGQSPMPMLLPAPPPDRIIAPTASSVVSISDPASASVKAVSLPIATPSPVAGYGLHKQRQRLVDTAEYRQCLLRALNAGLKDEEARSQAVVYLREIMPDSFIEAVLREQEVEEAIRNSAFKFSSLSFGGELEAIRLLMKLTGETKPKARAMLQLSKERMSEEGKNSARNEEVMVRKWVEESLVCMREREEKKKEKKEKKAISQKSVGPEEEKKEGRGGRRGPKRGLTIRDAFELRELVGRESEEGATGPAGEAADEEEPEDADADSDDSSDDREVTAVDKGLFSLEQCVATLKLKSQERSKEFPSSALSIDDEEASLREERLQRIQDAKTKKWQEEESNRLSSDYEAFKQQRFGRGGGSLSYETIMSQREQLPAYINRDRILDVISASRVVVISGDTGCGKTTQVPQLVLDQFIAEGQGGRVNIIVTQPRRICAVSVAERIAEQRGERVGKTVGFHIRLESKKSKHSRIVLMTTGVLLRMLQLQDNLSGVTHVFVDEVHERDMNTDFLLIVLKELMTKRPDLKIILMSATLKADLFQKYFKTEGCQLVNIPGRTFPVTTYYLEQALALSGFRMSPKSPCVYRSNSKPSNGRVENEKGKASERQAHVQNIHRLLTGKYDHEIIASLTLVDESILNKELILAMVLCIVSGNLNGSDPSKADVSRKGGGARPPAIADDGAILIFVDGFSSIKDVVDCLKSHPSLQNNQDFWILPLHSSLSTAEQRKVFKIPPRGVRKIIVCTNIAETSVTIEDVVFVIDTCRVKENRYDEASQVSVLEDCYISSANASQRRGRAGRVRPGVCFHLVSSVTFATFSAYSVPEMLRLSLEEVILQILALDLGNPHTFLSKALSPPSSSAINQALTYLESLSAVRVDDCSPGSRRSSDVVEATITPLGFHLAALPINPRIGKLILYATLLGCVSPVITIAAALSTKSPFSAGFDDRDEMDTAKQLLSVGDSDLLTVLNAYNSWRSIITPGNSSKLRSAEGDFCSRNCLSLATLQLIEQMRGQFLALLVDIGFLGPDVSIYNVDQSRENRNGNNLMMIKAVLCAGLVPNVLRIPVPPPTTRANLTSTSQSQSQSQSPSIPFTAARGKKEPEIETTSIMLPKTLGECQLKGAGFEGPILMNIHPSSVLFTRKTLDSQFILYLEAMRTSKLYGKEVSTVHPLLLTLFAAHCNVYVDNGIIVLENWIVFKAKKEFCQAINKIRKIFESAFIERVLDPLAGESDNWTLAVALVELIVEEINVGNVSHLGRLEERVNPQPQLASGRGGRLQSASSEAETTRSQSSSSSSSSANNSGRNAGATSGFGISKGNGKIVTADTSDPKPYANSSIGLNAEIATARSNDISAAVAAAAVATGGGAGGGAGRGRGRGGGRDVAGGRGEDGRGGRGRGEDGRGRGEDGRGGRGGRSGGSGKVVGGRGGAGDGR